MYRVVCEYRIYSDDGPTVMVYGRKQTAETICGRVNAAILARRGTKTGSPNYALMAKNLAARLRSRV